MPSTIPIFTRLSMASTLGKYVTLVKREPLGVCTKEKTIRIVGMSALGWPSSCAKPSSTSIRRPRSTVTNRHHPCDLLPSGPVM